MIGINLENRWIITSLLSDSGGNGQVWKGKNLKGEYAAIKILRNIEDLNKSNRRRARFENEIKKLEYIKALEIKSVMPIIDHGYTKDGKPWYSMPVAHPLQIPETFNERIALLTELANVVSNLHKHAIEHRDIKPNNLLMLDGALVVCDFGLSRLDDDEHLTMTGERVGSVGYTAIECVGKSDQPRFECDVYALGKISWVVLTGKSAPPHGELKSPEDDLYSYWPSIDMDKLSQLQTLLIAATQRSPQARPTANQFCDGLTVINSFEFQGMPASKTKPSDRARNLFRNHAEISKRITDVNNVLSKLQKEISDTWFSNWGDTIEAIGWGKSRINGGRWFGQERLQDNWKQGSRHFSKGPINGVQYEISLTFKYKEPVGENRVDLGFMIAVEIPGQGRAIPIVEKEYESYSLGPQLENLKLRIKNEVSLETHQFVTIEKLNEQVEA